MHRTNRVPRALWGGLLSLGLLLGGTASARAQAEVAPARPASAAFPVAVNVTKPFQMAKKQAISQVVNEKESVARISAVPGDPTTVLITGVSPGLTQVTFTAADKTVQVVDVIVQLDIDLLKNLLSRAVPTASVTPIPGAGNTIIMTGTVAHPEDVQVIMGIAASVTGGGTGPAQIINAMRVGGVQQVQLDVVIARVARGVTRTFAFDFLRVGHTSFQNITTGFILDPSTIALSPSGGGVASTTSGSGTFQAGSAQGLNLAFLPPQAQMFAFLRALRENNLAKFEAEPHLVTLSGRSASFLSGGQQPVPTVSGFGGTAGVDFVPFGTQVDFLPIVLGNGRIYLEVNPQINQLDQATALTLVSGGVSSSIPGRITQNVRTVVEMEVGQTLVIGGLVQRSVIGNTSKIPIVGDLPFVGAAFSSKRFQEVEEELLVLVTPYLVDPLDCNQVPKYLPGQETRTPDDFELFLEGILEAPRGQREVFPDRHYRPAYKCSPTADVFPCCNNLCNSNGGQTGGAGCSSCGGAAVRPAVHTQVAPAAGTVVYESPLPAQGRPVMMESTIVVPVGSPMPVSSVMDGPQ